MGTVDLVDAVWCKSSYSAGTECVEVAVAGGVVAVRDSKDPGGAVLVVSRGEFAAFVRAAAGGELPRG